MDGAQAIVVQHCLRPLLPTNRFLRMDLPIEAARNLVRNARRITVLTGAGMSAESGVPTFRQAQDGLWSRYDPGELATPEAWRRDPALVWGWYLWRMALVRAAQPNPGHAALAIAAKQRDLCVITQNVDDLHERAGSGGVIHLHGGLFAHRCFACARAHGDIDIPDASTAPLRVEPPRCGHCGGRVRPGVVWFGEALPADAFRAASRAVEECDLTLVVGTSGIVHPAAGLPALAKRYGAVLVEVNPERTALSPLMDASVCAGAALVLPQLFV